MDTLNKLIGESCESEFLDHDSEELLVLMIERAVQAIVADREGTIENKKIRIANSLSMAGINVPCNQNSRQSLEIIMMRLLAEYIADVTVRERASLYIAEVLADAGWHN